jgi:hypothetical protein
MLRYLSTRNCDLVPLLLFSVLTAASPTGYATLPQQMTLSEESRNTLETLRDAHAQFRVRPESGHIKATLESFAPDRYEEKKVEVWWDKDRHKRVTDRYRRYDAVTAAKMGKPEGRLRIVAVADGSERVVSRKDVPAESGFCSVIRGNQPGFNPSEGEFLTHVEPDNAWYKYGVVGTKGDVDELLDRFLSPDYKFPITVTQGAAPIIELAISDGAGGGLSMRFDLTQEARCVEMHSWYESPERNYSRLATFAWTQMDNGEWRLARKEYSTGTSRDTPQEERHRQVLTVHAYEPSIAIPEATFDLQQIVVPDGAYLVEYSEDGQWHSRVVGADGESNNGDVSDEKLRALGRLLESDGFGSPNKAQR